MAVTTRKRRTTKEEETVSDVTSEVVEEAVETVPASIEEDVITPIKFSARGPRLSGVVYNGSDDEIKFSWADPRGEVVNLPVPLAVRVSKEGGPYYKIETFFPITSAAEVPLEKMDGTTLTIRLGVNPETNKIQGRRFHGLVGVGWVRDKLDELDPELKYSKYICLTDNIDHFSDVPRSLKGLGAPLVS